MKTRLGLVALAASAGLASPALADTTHEFVLAGVGEVTSSYVDDYCWAEDQCTDGVPTPIGSPESFTFAFRATFDDDGSLIEILHPFDFVGFSYGAPVIGASFVFENRKVVSGHFYTDTIQDVCGGGVGVSVSGSAFTFGRSTCGWEYSVYPFIDDYGSGRLTQYRDGVAVPEPSAWALMILGFGAAGARLRLRRRCRSAT